MYNLIYFYQLLLLYNNHRKIGLYYEIFLIILNLDLMGDQCKLYDITQNQFESIYGNFLRTLHHPW